MYEAYFRSCKVRGLTEQTIKTYKIGLKYLEDYLEKNELDISEIKKENVEEIIAILDNGKRNKKTINSHLISIRTYLYYEMENGVIPAFKIKLVKGDENIKEIYTDNELKKLLERPQKKEGFNTFKTWALINFIFGTGCRLSSALNIQNRDIDLDNGLCIFRHTKNRKQQIVPISSTLSKVLYDYMKVRGGLDTDYLFCNSVGDAADIRTVQQQIRNYNLSRKVSKTSAHLLRHSFATIFIRNGGDIYRLSQLLGHSSIAITEHYIHSLPVDLVGNYDSINPLEQFTRKPTIKMS